MVGSPPFGRLTPILQLSRPYSSQQLSLLGSPRRVTQEWVTDNLLMGTKPRLIILTKDGLQRVETELRYLKSVCRMEIAERLKDGLQLGNWDEAPEYIEALKEKALLEDRIKYLERRLGSVALLQYCPASDCIAVGARVRIRELHDGEVMECVLIGSLQARPLECIISDESPLGDALLGHKVGDRIQVRAPQCVFEYEILEVRPSGLAATTLIEEASCHPE